jgi:hypothetical protein
MIGVVMEISLSVPGYDPAIGALAPGEGGTVTVEVVNGSVEIFCDPAGLRDLARLCLACHRPGGSGVHGRAMCDVSGEVVDGVRW